jgi:hypothetical protein
VQLFEALDDEGASGVFPVAADAVKGQDKGVAKFSQMGEQPEGGSVGQMGIA